MKDKLKHMAELSGFICWEDEEWKPEGETIDWASADEESFLKYSRLLVSHSLADFYRNYLDLNSNQDIVDQIKRYVDGLFGEQGEQND
jgi:hypothetical protein|nr:MAG: hypothetical protein [Caudoviricetes sp.]